MLSIGAMSSDQAGYYLGLAREDYYLEGGEPPGQWFGDGARAIGLVGTVAADHLYNLFDGRSPDGVRSLVQRQSHSGKADHRPGWDLTFSAPKSVSTLWSQVGPEMRGIIQASHDAAVRAALTYLEQNAAFTRRGRGGSTQEKVGVVVATFEHSTSRAQDPQLHTHALLMNLSIREDGSTGTLSSLDVFLSKMAAGALYRAELSKQLQQELGVNTHRDKSWFEVSGVPKGLVDLFSKRRIDIEQILRETGNSSAKASAIAAIQTRSSKEDFSRSKLLDDWSSEGLRFGWSRKDAEAVCSRALLPEETSAGTLEVCQSAASRLTQDEAFFTEREFVRYAAEDAQCQGIGASELVIAARSFLETSPEIVRLGSHRNEQRFTTVRMFDLERSLLQEAESMSKNLYHQLESSTLLSNLVDFAAVSEEQQNAIRHITVETGALAIVSGMAGTGKTRMLEIARQAWEAESFEVRGIALAARAAKELSAGANIPSQTLAKTLLEIDQGTANLHRNLVFVLDEAGMVATPELERLASVLRRNGVKLVMIGDERQLQPIGPGAPFKELGQIHGKAELLEIRRQSEPWARKAVVDLAAGNAKDALIEYAKRGLVHMCDSQQESMQALMEQWRQDGGRAEDSLILASTRSEVRQLNALIQVDRLSRLQLGKESVKVNGEEFHKNDQVMFTKNMKTLGVTNGSRGVILSVDDSDKTLRIRLDSGERFTLNVDKNPHVALGYAATTHKAQGATTQRAYILGGGAMQARELSYVQGSRAKTETRFFLTTSEAGDELASVAKEMSRSRQKAMANAILRESVQPPPDQGFSI